MVMVSSKNRFCFFHSNIDFYPFPTKKLIHSCNKTGPTGACLKPFHGYQHHGGGHVGGPRCIDGLSCSGKRKDASTDPYMLINQVTYIYVSQMMSRYTGVNIYIMFIVYSIVYTTHLWFFIYNILLISKNIESMNHKWIHVINWCGEETVISHFFGISPVFPGFTLHCLHWSTHSGGSTRASTQNHKRRQLTSRKVWWFQGFFVARKSSKRIQKLHPLGN